MIESFIHTTENNNLYIYDDQYRLSMLAHPEIEKVHNKSIDIDPYYLKKYEYLKKHGFFAKPKLANFENVDELMVKESIIQTKQIVFEVTDFCNLNCTYCGYGEFYEGFDVRNCKNIDIHDATSLLNYVFDLKPRDKYYRLNIGFFGGEPLLNISFIKQIVEIINQLKSEKEVNIDFSMTTNATLLHKHIKFLVANKFYLLISLDGNEKNHSYRFFHKNEKSSFNKVIENIDMIQRDYPDYFANHVNFNAVLHDRNSVKDIYEFIYTRYNKFPNIAELTLDDIKSDKEDRLKKMFQNKRKSEVEYQKEDSNLLSISHNGLLSHELTEFLVYYSINFYVSNLLSLLYNREEHFPTCTCLPFSRKIFLTTHSRLLPCEKINYKYSMGKVSEKNVIIDIPEITRQYSFYYDHLKKVCQNCYAYKFCGVCLFNIKKLDKLNTEEFICNNFYDQKAFKRKLYRIFSFLEKFPTDFFYSLENVSIS